MKMFEVLLEAQVASNKIIDAILKNSGLLDDVQNRNTHVQKINKLFARFKQIQNQLKPDTPQIVTFLNQFDGNHGSKKFDGDVRDILNYNLNQLEFLINEYPIDQATDNNDEVNRLLLQKSQFNPESVELSKKLWYDESSAIINLPGFRVYKPKNQSDSIKYGWYEQEMMNKIRPGHHSWCVTWRPTQGSNRWEYYRKEGGTFYFIIDESKLESEDINVKKYYLTALQIVTGKRYGHRGYEITDITNPGEKEVGWNDVVSLFPQLADFKDLIQPVEFTEEEIAIQDVVSRMNEDSSSPFYFPRRSTKEKKDYINSHLKISKPESWLSMTKELRELYIVLTNRGEYTYRFPNFELLRIIKKTGFGKLLNDTIKAKENNEGIKSLSEYLMRDLNPQEERVGIKNPNIILYKTRRGRYGLWNHITSDWLEKNGDVYEPSYALTEEDIYENKNTKDKYYIDTYSSADGDYFVSVTHIHDIDSYFFSKQAWERIKDKVKELPIEKDFETQQDIDELKKGV